MKSRKVYCDRKSTSKSRHILDLKSTSNPDQILVKSSRNLVDLSSTFKSTSRTCSIFHWLERLGFSTVNLVYRVSDHLRRYLEFTSHLYRNFSDTMRTQITNHFDGTAFLQYSGTFSPASILNCSSQIPMVPHFYSVPLEKKSSANIIFSKIRGHPMLRRWTPPPI